jgi:hypothetical protein
MNLDELHAKLIAAARAQAPSQRVPFAFEKRITALLGSRPVTDLSALWARALWRGAVPCVALMLLLSAWSLLSPATNPPATDLSQELDNTVLAAAVPEQPSADLPR